MLSLRLLSSLAGSTDYVTFTLATSLHVITPEHLGATHSVSGSQ